jgi:dTDP-glucose pyrophosphorylase
MDSDSIVGEEATEALINTNGNAVLVKDHDGLTTAFSTVSLDDYGCYITDIQEKTGHSYTICVGMYKFDFWSEFVTSVCKLRFSSEKEVYLSAVMQDLLLIGEDVRAVSTNRDWINLGTPSDLKQAERI